MKKQLDTAIDLHVKAADYMIKNEMYHAYDLNEQLSHDDMKIKKALELVSK
ncbi:Spore coat protein [Mesobacillus zeae]